MPAVERYLDRRDPRTAVPRPAVQYRGRAAREAIAVDEASFRWALTADAMATEKLAEGLRLFHADTERLEALVARAAAL